MISFSKKAIKSKKREGIFFSENLFLKPGQGNLQLQLKTNIYTEVYTVVDTA